MEIVGNNNSIRELTDSKIQRIVEMFFDKISVESAVVPKPADLNYTSYK